MTECGEVSERKVDGGMTRLELECKIFTKGLAGLESAIIEGFDAFTCFKDD